MKVLFVYNGHSVEDVQIMNKVLDEMKSYVEIIEINSASRELRNAIRATPAIIPVVDDMQGEFIKGEGIDGQLIAIAAINKWLQREELVVHNQETERFDNFVNNEKTKAIDKYTEELLTGGIL